MKRQLLIIDPQIDFCRPGAPLYVTNAEHDCARLAKFLSRSLDYIDEIRVTLDSHQPVHIAHPICWVDAQGNHPNPFTIISTADVEGNKPVWKAYNPAWQQRQVEYIKALAAGNRYLHCIWPVHCLIGTEGHAVLPELNVALREWQDQFAMIDYVTKGSNPTVEQFSAVKAEVIDPDDHTTGLNTTLIQRLQDADEIYLSGQALSHCVANTVRDIANEFGDEHIKKLVLLENTTSPVGDQPGSTMFADMAINFIKEMTARGMRVAKTTDF